MFPQIFTTWREGWDVSFSTSETMKERMREWKRKIKERKWEGKKKCLAQYFPPLFFFFSPTSFIFSNKESRVAKSINVLVLFLYIIFLHIFHHSQRRETEISHIIYIFFSLQGFPKSKWSTKEMQFLHQMGTIM